MGACRSAGSSSTPNCASLTCSGPSTSSCVKQGDQEVQAFQKLCRVAFACEADAQQALATFAHGLEATFVHESTVRSIPRYGQRGDRAKTPSPRR